MDIQLPGINGITAFRQIRDDPATSTIPVIAVTASAMVQDRPKIMAAVLFVTPSQRILLEPRGYILIVTAHYDGPEARARFSFYLDSMGRPWLEPIP